LATGEGKAGRMAVRVGYLWAAEAAIALMFVLPHELASKLGVLIVAAAGVALVLMIPRLTIAAGLTAVVVLLVVGVISASEVPGLAQAVEAKNSLVSWKDRQSHVAACDLRLQAAAEAGDVARFEALNAHCARFSQNAWFW
jgi:hypothetical protein